MRAFFGLLRCFVDLAEGFDGMEDFLHFDGMERG